MTDAKADLLEKLRMLQSAIARESSAVPILAILLRQLQDIGEAAATAGFPALLDICLMLKDGLESVPDKGNGLSVPDMEELAKWPDRIMDYIKAPASAAARDALMSLLCYPTWGSSLSTDITELLKTMLEIIPGAATPATAAGTELDIDAAGAATAGDEADAWEGMERGICADIPAQLRELLGIMIAELGNIHQSISKVSSIYNTGGAESAHAGSALHELGKNLEFYGEAVKSIDFKGLAEVVAQAGANVMTLQHVDSNQRTAALALLVVWPEKILAYLRNPFAAAAARNLLDFMQDPHWPVPLAETQASLLETAFASREYKVREEKPPRKQTAIPEDVTLELQDDASRDLLEGMLTELPVQTEQFSGAIERLINGGKPQDIVIAKRIAHTLKGAGNTVGIRGIASLTHHLEDILQALSRNERLPGPRIAATLMNASDCLAAMSEALLGLGAPPEDAQDVLQEVLDLANLIDTEGIDSVNAHAALKPTSTTAHTETAAEPARPQPQDAPEREQSAIIRVSSEFIDNLLRLAGETIIMTGQIRNSIKLALAEMKEMKTCFEMLKQLGVKVEQIIDIRDLNQMQEAVVHGKYDALEMDQYTELHLFSRQLVETAIDADEVNNSISKNLARLEEMLADQARINDEMQEGVMRTRMLPVNSQFPRLQRCVRQAEKLTGKAVQLQLEGGETLMDSDTLNSVLDPLMHVLRNAVDHGIEPEEERIAAGKEAQGSIRLSFSRQGNTIVVRCRDDGRGLDLQAIRHKAVEQGLLQAHEEITEEELKQIIMHSGFSTRSVTTQVSGRGIGMDAVNAAITARSGTVRLDSDPGRGCQVEIRIPQDQISLHTLLIRVGPRIVAIANRGIARIIHHEDGELAGAGVDMVFATAGRSYPAQPIEALLNIVTERRQQKRMPPTAILFHADQAESGMLAVMVDKIISTADLVVKGLGHYVQKIPGILGAAILGDGSVTAVLDIPELLRTRDATASRYAQFARTDYRRALLPTALVVDDSLSARRSLEQFMQDAGYTVRTARDGIEAFDMIKTHKPDILLSDLEMPRMNGVELISHVRADRALADIPIIMITSRAAAKHEQEARAAGVDVYLTKPFSEDELLEHIHKLHRSTGTR